MFHSARCGYRAQYYHSIATGERANSLAVQTLIEAVDSQIEDSRLISQSWIQASLTGTTTKAWIHQGLWLRYRKCSDRMLGVSRWLKGLDSSDPRERRLAQWARLVPREEGRIDLKGTFLTLKGVPLSINPKEDRSKEIRDLGFT